MALRSQFARHLSRSPKTSDRSTVQCFCHLSNLSPAFPGDHIGLETPVPIPNTEVKQSKPMVLASTERVGHCRDSFSARELVPPRGGLSFFSVSRPWQTPLSSLGSSISRQPASGSGRELGSNLRGVAQLG